MDESALQTIAISIQCTDDIIAHCPLQGTKSFAEQSRLIATKLEIFKAVRRQLLFFWDVTPRGLVTDYRRFGATCCPPSLLL
jgi:hypothetical protein